MERQQINIQHEFKGSLRGWVKKQIRQNLWRYAHVGFDVDDLLQEAHICFYKCKESYGCVDPAHFMALFKTTVINHFTKIADQSAKSSFIRQNNEQDISDIEYLGVLVSDLEPSLFLVLDRLPQQVKDLVVALNENPGESRIKSVGKRYKNRTLQRRESLNEYFCRLVGADPNNLDLVSLTRKALNTSN